jgi:uncharacterized membrane protein YfcA
MPEDALAYLAACGAAFLVGLSKGGLPAVGAAGVPVLALVMPPFAAAALLLPIYIATDMVGLWLYRRSYSARNLRILIPAGVLGVAIGWVFAERISDAAAALAVGLLGVMFCVSQWRGGAAAAPPRPADAPRGWFWGALAGLASFLAHAGAAPFQAYVVPQRLEKMVFVGTSTITFAALNIVKLLPYWALGALQASDTGLVAAALVVGVAGAFSGARIISVLPERLFFRLVTIGLFAVSVKLIADGAAGLF